MSPPEQRRRPIIDPDVPVVVTLQAYVDQRVDSVSERVDRMDKRFDKLDGRFDKLDEKLDGVQNQMSRAGGSWSTWEKAGALLVGTAIFMGSFATPILMLTHHS